MFKYKKQKVYFQHKIPTLYILKIGHQTKDWKQKTEVGTPERERLFEGAELDSSPGVADAANQARGEKFGADVSGKDAFPG